MPLPKDLAQYRKIEQGIWDVEIGLDNLYCHDGGESEEVASLAEVLLDEATRLRKRIIRLLGSRPSGGPDLGSKD